ncbi:MAG: hypothetical protein ACPGLY_12995 [Rubripirellula sp.]
MSQELSSVKWEMPTLRDSLTFCHQPPLARLATFGSFTPVGFPSAILGGWMALGSKRDSLTTPALVVETTYGGKTDGEIPTLTEPVYSPATDFLLIYPPLIY